MLGGEWWDAPPGGRNARYLTARGTGSTDATLPRRAWRKSWVEVGCYSPASGSSWSPTRKSVPVSIRRLLGNIIAKVVSCRSRPKGKGEEMDMLLSVPMGFVSGLEAQSELSELLDELYYYGLS